MTVVAVVGSRRWSSAFQDVLLSYLTRLNATAVVTGTAFGADQCAKEAAEELHLPVTRVMARWWTTHAARDRNRIIFSQAHHLLLLWDGRSPGTREAIDLARSEFGHLPHTVLAVVDNTVHVSEQFDGSIDLCP